ncbi:hypothetical protein HDU86_006396 [Geranomyces michiganensis]|nr:hypothetical protein HDU86_006396 [Geranomyces michiganensis]
MSDSITSPPAKAVDLPARPELPRKSTGPLPHFFQVLNLEDDYNARHLVAVFQEQIGLAEEIVKSREDLTEAEEALGKVEQARKEFAQERKRDEKKLDEKARQALKKEKKNAERAARKRGFPISGGLTVTSTNVLTFVEAQASLAQVSGPKDICRVVEIIKNEGTLVSDSGRYFHTGPIRNETTFQLLCGLAFREVADAREKVTALEKRSKDLDNMADKGHLALMDSVRKRYKVLAVRMHPDKLPRTPTDEDYQRFRELQTAHQVLSDTELRRRYIQMMDHNAFLATLPKQSKDADQEGHRPVIKRDNQSSATRTVNPNDHRRLTGGFPHQCTMPRIIDTIVSDTKRGHSRVLLGWTCASAEELQISRYELHMKERGISPEAGDWTRIYLGWSTEWWTEILSPGHYSFRVRAENNLGLGEWSTFLDHYVEDVQAMRQLRREEYEKNKEERRAKVVSRLRKQISHVLSMRGNVPTTEKLSKLRKLLDQARRSRMDEIIIETEEIVQELEARVLKHEEQHLWKSKLNELVKAALKEDGDGRVPREGSSAIDAEHADGEEFGPTDDECDYGGSSVANSSPVRDNTWRDTIKQEDDRNTFHYPPTSSSSSDFQDFLTSLPSMYPPDTHYILPPPIRNQIVQTVQSLIRNRPALTVASVVPETNDPSDILLSVPLHVVYKRIIAICEAALAQKEYLGGQAGFREIEAAIDILPREMEDSDKSMDKKRVQIELFLDERARAMKARAEADRLVREKPIAGSESAEDDAVENESRDEAAAAGEAPASGRTMRGKPSEEPPPPYTPRDGDEAGAGVDHDDEERDNNFEFVGTPRLRRRGTRGGTRRRKNSDATTGIAAISAGPGTAASASIVSPQHPTLSPRPSRRGGTRARAKKDAANIAAATDRHDASVYQTPTVTAGSSPNTRTGGPVVRGTREPRATEKHKDKQFDDPASKHMPASPESPVDSQLVQLLTALGLEQHVETFSEHEVAYSDLRHLREWDLVQLGISKVGPRKRLMHLIGEMESRKGDPALLSQDSASAADWLGKLGLGIYADAFSKEDVTFDDLKTLKEEDLVNTFGIDKIGHLARLISAVEDVKNLDASAKVLEQSVDSPINADSSLGSPAKPPSSAARSPAPQAEIGSLGATETLPADNTPRILDSQPESKSAVGSGVGIPYPVPGRIGDTHSADYPGDAAAIAADAYGSQRTQNLSSAWTAETVTTDNIDPPPSNLARWSEPMPADVTRYEPYSFPGAPLTAYHPGSGRKAGNASPATPAASTAFDNSATDVLSVSYGHHGAGSYGRSQQNHQYSVYEQQQQQQQAFAQHPHNLHSSVRTNFTAEGAGMATGLYAHTMKTVGIPPAFACALTKRVMTCPVYGPDGYWYEYSALRSRLLNDNTWRSPVTMAYYPVEVWHRALNSPDLSLKNAIDAWVMRTRRRGSVGALNAARDLWTSSTTGESGSAVSASHNGSAASSHYAAAAAASNSTATTTSVAAASQPFSKGIPAAAASSAGLATALKTGDASHPPAVSQGLKATMGLSGWTADVPGGASIWR